MANVFAFAAIAYFLGKGVWTFRLIYLLVTGGAVILFFATRKTALRRELVANGLVSGLFCDLLIAKLDLQGLLASLEKVSLPLFLMASLSICVAIFCKVARWRWLLFRMKLCSLSSLLPPVMIGLFLNGLLPARAGDFASAYVLGKRERLSKVAIFATIFVEKIFDGVLILSILAGVVLFFNLNAPILRYLQGAGVGFYLLMTTVLLLLYFKHGGLKTLLHRVVPAGLADRITPLIDHFVEGLHVVEQPRQLAMTLCYSLLLWGAVVLSKVPILAAFDYPFPFYTVFLLTAMTSLSLLIPAVAGGLGVFHYSVVLSFQIINLNLPPGATPVALNDALAIAVAIHLAIFLPDVLLGFPFFLIDRFPLKSLLGEREATAESLSGP